MFIFDSTEELTTFGRDSRPRFYTKDSDSRSENMIPLEFDRSNTENSFSLSLFHFELLLSKVHYGGTRDSML